MTPAGIASPSSVLKSNHATCPIHNVTNGDPIVTSRLSLTPPGGQSGSVTRNRLLPELSPSTSSSWVNTASWRAPSLNQAVITGDRFISESELSIFSQSIDGLRKLEARNRANSDARSHSRRQIDLAGPLSRRQKHFDFLENYRDRCHPRS